MPKANGQATRAERSAANKAAFHAGYDRTPPKAGKVVERSRGPALMFPRESSVLIQTEWIKELRLLANRVPRKCDDPRMRSSLEKLHASLQSSKPNKGSRREMDEFTFAKSIYNAVVERCYHNAPPIRSKGGFF